MYIINSRISKRTQLLSGIAAVLMLAALVIGCKTNVSNAPETFSVTFSAGEHGAVEAKVDGKAITTGYAVQKDTTVVFTAKPADGYTVDKWTVNGMDITNMATTYSHKVTAKTDVKVTFKTTAPPTVAVTGVTLEPNGLTLEEGKSEKLTATVLPENATNKKVTWSSGNTEVADVDQEGKVTAKTVGTAKITVTTEDGSKTGECTVTVTAKALPTFTVTFGVDGGNGTLKAKADGIPETTTSPITVEKGKTVMFTATASSSYEVEKWTKDGTDITGAGTNPTYSYTVTAAADIKVRFKSVMPPSGDFVAIIPPAVGIVGVEPTYILPETEDYWKGVFIAGRKVKLSPYKLGKTEVTYELWHSVLKWNTDNSKGYTFANQGREGNDGTDGAAPTEAGKKKPVTKVSWRDCIVWCNAYTQMTTGADAECVYRDSNNHNTVLKSSTAAACDAAYADMSKKGFRLPTEAEWEYAARWQGSNSTNAVQYGEVWLTKLNSASGAKDKWDTDETGEVAWYNGNSENKTYPVGQKRANALGLYDMSGNVWEWCFDGYGNIETGDVTDPAASGDYRILRGGSWNHDAKNCVVGERINGGPDLCDDYLGLRLVLRP